MAKIFYEEILLDGLIKLQPNLTTESLPHNWLHIQFFEIWNHIIQTYCTQLK
jgi:hypothetical protein